jgi:hypothetical protein
VCVVLNPAPHVPRIEWCTLPLTHARTQLGKRDYVTSRMWKHAHGPYRLVLNSAAAKQIAWHCEHYAARGLMRTLTGAQLAAEVCACVCVSDLFLLTR